MINFKRQFLLTNLLFLLVLATGIHSVKAVLVPSDWHFIPESIKIDLQDLSAQQLLSAPLASKTFHLLFVTASKTQATNSNIEYYNTLVQNVARRNATLTNIIGVSFAGKFRVLGSTTEIAARDNTNTNVASHTASGYQIYFLGGHQLANNYNDFYDNNGWILPPASHEDRLTGNFFNQRNELGEIVEKENNADRLRVWTGSKKDGTSEFNRLGQGSVWFGHNRQEEEIKADISGANSGAFYRLYGLSPAITIFPTFTIATFTLKGNNPDFIRRHSVYRDSGITVNGRLGGTGTLIDLSSSLSIVVSNTLNTTHFGRYEITYSATDSLNNGKIAKRTIYVISDSRLDLDNNGKIRTNSDGLMIRRFNQGQRDATKLIKGLIAKGGAIKDGSDMAHYLNYIDATNIFDIDMSGSLDNTDSILILRYLVGQRNPQSLVRGVKFLDNAKRKNAAALSNYFKSNLRVWNEAASRTAWPGRTNHSSTAFNGKMWVLGGFDGSKNLKDVWSSTDGVNWLKAATPPWSARSLHSSVVFNDKLWLLGGFSNKGKPFNDIWAYDGTTWTLIAAEASASTSRWSARHGHSSVVLNNKIWLLGGLVDTERKNDVWYSEDGVTWTETSTSTSRWSARHSHSSAIFNNKMWVLGGNSGKTLKDVWSSTDGVNWLKAATPPWSARHSHNNVVFEDKIWVFNGGRDTLSDVWLSNNGSVWQRIEDIDWTIREGQSSMVFNNKIWVLGGSIPGLRRYFNDVWVLSNQKIEN